MNKRILKLLTLFCMVALLCCTLCFFACNDDENTPVPAPVDLTIQTNEYLYLNGRYEKAVAWETATVDIDTFVLSKVGTVKNYYLDRAGTLPIDGKSVSLSHGLNFVYLHVTGAGERAVYEFVISREQGLTVSFMDGNGAVLSSQYVRTNSTVTAPAVSPQKDHYEFTAWDFNFETPITADTQILPIFTPISYSISFDYDGGTLPGGTATVSEYNIETDTFVAINQTPNKTGYDFVGWSIDGGEPTLTASIEKGSYGNKVITAKYTPISYSITFDYDGGTLPDGTATVSEYNIETDTFVAINKAPNKDGYDFVGWSIDGGEPTLTASIEKGSYGNKVITAKYTTTAYTITYELDGGTLPLGSSKVDLYNVETDTFVAIDVVPTKTGYSFDGWSLDGGSVSTSITIEKGTMGNKVITAKYTAKTYVVTFDKGGANETQKTYTFDQSIGELPTIDAEGTNSWYVGGNRLVSNMLWNLDLTGEIVATSQAVTNCVLLFKLNGGKIDDSSADFEHTVDFGSSLASSVELGTPVKEGYVFSGWFYNDGTTNIWVHDLDVTVSLGADVVINAVYAPENDHVTIVFDARYGEEYSFTTLKVTRGFVFQYPKVAGILADYEDYVFEYYCPGVKEWLYDHYVYKPDQTTNISNVADMWQYIDENGLDELTIYPYRRPSIT